MHFERHMPFKMHKIIKKKSENLPYIECSDLLPETHLFFYRPHRTANIFCL